MVLLAALSLGPCVGLVRAASPSHADKLQFPDKPQLLHHSNSFPHLYTAKGRGTENSRSLLRRAPVVAVTLDSDQTESSEPAKEQEKPKRYYFVVANAKFMLDEEEHFKELMEERKRNFSERNRQQDFWLVIEPKFLDKFPDITKRLKRPAVALVSTDGTWITFMKLRLDRVLVAEFDAESLEEALASNPVDLHFEKPEKWVAPYRKYEFGWWEPFLPPVFSKSKE